MKKLLCVRKPQTIVNPPRQPTPCVCNRCAPPPPQTIAMELTHTLPQGVHMARSMRAYTQCQS
eukprot:4731726-Lingulodinium_polyedra.AAC.1